MKPNQSNKQSSFNESFLNYCSKGDFKEAKAYLLQYISKSNSPVNFPREETTEYTILHRSCLNNDFFTSKFIIDCYNEVFLRLNIKPKEQKRGISALVNSKSNQNMTPLHYASNRGNLPLIDLLIENGAHVDALSEHGLSVLHMAAQGDQPQSILYFVVNYGFETSQIDYGGSSPLHWACYLGCENAFEYLITRTTDVSINAQDNSGMTPLFLAILSDRINFVIKLIHKGASLDIKDKKGRTPKDLAIEKKAAHIVELFDKSKEIGMFSLKPPLKKLEKSKINLFSFLILSFLIQFILVMLILPHFGTYENNKILRVIPIFDKKEPDFRIIPHNIIIKKPKSNKLRKSNIPYRRDDDDDDDKPSSPSPPSPPTSANTNNESSQSSSSENENSSLKKLVKTDKIKNIWFIITMITWILMLICFTMLVCADPGFLSLNKNENKIIKFISQSDIHLLTIALNYYDDFLNKKNEATCEPNEYLTRDYCYKCGVKKDKYSVKHCFYCDKCVNDFDHHCFWVNKCIGKNNICLFRIFLIQLFLYLVLAIVISSLTIICLRNNIPTWENLSFPKLPIEKLYTRLPLLFFSVSVLCMSVLFIIPTFTVLYISLKNMIEKKPQPTAASKSTQIIKKEANTTNKFNFKGKNEAFSKINLEGLPTIKRLPKKSYINKMPEEKSNQKVDPLIPDNLETNESKDRISVLLNK